MYSNVNGELDEYKSIDIKNPSIEEGFFIKV